MSGLAPSRRIYCDYNATAPLRPEAAAAMGSVLGFTGNASSVHAEGRKARAAVERAREQVAMAIGACRDDIAFASGGTEAVQAPLRGALKAADGFMLLASEIEHDAVQSLVAEFAADNSDAAKAYEAQRAASPNRDSSVWAEAQQLRAPMAMARIPPLPSGQIDLDMLRVVMKAAGQQGTQWLVSLMLVNNETGVIQPVAEAAELVHAAGGLIHCDAIQGLGKVNVSVVDLDVDYLSLSAHKVGGPQGVGAFYVKPGAPFRAVQTGGGQEFGRRSGTENVAGIAGFGAAAEAAVNALGEYEALRPMRDAMEARLKAAAPSLTVYGEDAPRVAGVSCFGVEDLPSETQIMGLDLAGFAVSAGSACSSGKVKPSRVLSAMLTAGRLDDTAARSAVRASFGWATQAQDFDALADAWIAMARRARPNLFRTEASRHAG